MQKYTDSAKRELISSRDSYRDCAAMFCFGKLSGLFCDFLNKCSTAMVGQIPGNIQNHCLIPQKSLLMLMFDTFMHLTHFDLKAKHFEKHRLDS